MPAYSRWDAHRRVTSISQVNTAGPHRLKIQGGTRRDEMRQGGTGHLIEDEGPSMVAQGSVTPRPHIHSYPFSISSLCEVSQARLDTLLKFSWHAVVNEAVSKRVGLRIATFLVIHPKTSYKCLVFLVLVLSENTYCNIYFITIQFPYTNFQTFIMRVFFIAALLFQALGGVNALDKYCNYGQGLPSGFECNVCI